jgi:hypothetical protein
MARLIPRKQIEEQQDISASLNIRQNVNVGNDAIISGSLFVSKSFFLGTATSSKSEITGSVFLTGSLTIDGQLKVAAPETVLSVTSSNTLFSVDTQKYSGILAKDFGANVPTLYVSSTDGDDNNDGRTIQYPLRTIKRAAALAQPGYDGRYGFDTGSVFNGYVIKVQAGTYLEDNPVILPKNTTIWGAGLRITKINAKNPEQDLFYVNSGCYVAEVTVGGLRLWPNEKEPQRGFAFAFQPGAFITTSPYIQNCSQISNQENSFTELYEEIPPGGGGLYVNGDVIDPDSPLASMVLDAYTQISPNGVGCLVNGRGFIQLVSFFNNFSYYAIRVNNGGHATLNNSNISFGLYGMYASGSRFISGSGGNIDARDRVRAGWSVVVDVLNRGLDALPDVTVLNTAEGIKVTPFTQSYLSGVATASADKAAEVLADFNLVSAIVEKGTTNFPTLLARSSNKGYGFDSPYNILGAEQITSSISSASAADVSAVSESYRVTLGIFANGTGSYVFKSNTEDAIKVSTITPEPSAYVATNQITGSVSSSFDTVITILKGGVLRLPTIKSNTSSSIYVGNIEPFSTGVSSSINIISNVSSSLSTIYNIVANGTGSNIEQVPTNHKQSFTVTNNNSSSYQFEGVGSNPDLVLFRGLTYKFYISASNTFGGIDYPFWIRTQQIDGISEVYDYNDGVINNGDSVGNITFAVPYDAPNELYYVSQNSSLLGGKLKIINQNTTPRELIANTLTYPATILSSSVASDDVDKINAYDILVNNKSFIQEETILFLSSSWSDFSYNETTCRRDVGYIIDAVAKDLLYGGNEESIRAGLFYYQYPSEATTIQLQPTLTAVKYLSGLVDNLLKNKTFSTPDINNDSAASCIFDNRQFIQNETIAYLSSSWSTFEYNEEKCKRDVGYILDAVATDLRYGGNERSIEAGRFYYLYPSQATGSQLNQTVDGIKFAAGTAHNLILNKSYVTASISTKEAVGLIRNNKSLIQNETIEFINVAFPTLEYNTAKCRRDVGYILDGVATDLLYGGNERSVASGRYYYDFPSIATSVQRVETSGGIRYSKIITEYIIQNLILDTPRIIYNDEKNIKISALSNITSSFSGSSIESSLISSSFNIVEGIVKKGLDGINSIIAQNTNTNWSLNNPIKVSTTNQITNSYITPNEINTIGYNFDIVTAIIANGTGSLPILTASAEGLYKVTNIQQISSSAATNSETASISSSFNNIINIIKNGTGSLQPFTSSVSNNIKVTATSYNPILGGTSSHSASISSSMKVVSDVLQNGLTALPNLINNNLTSLIKVGNVAQITTSSLDTNLSASLFVSRSIAVVVDILRTGNVNVPKTDYVTQSFVSDKQTLASQHISDNLDFIKEETIAYLSSSWSAFDYNEAKCRRDIGFIVNGIAEDLYWGNISASVVNGQYYYEYPSQATGSQLQQTIDGIIYAGTIAQKVIQGLTYQQLTGSLASASLALKNNKGFIIDETITYMSSSWGSFDYNEATCRRDLNYIIDSVKTDLVYGGNQRTRLSAEYYFLYPSQATGSQLTQTLDAVNYASRIAQKVVVGESFTQANTNKLNASNLLSLNKNLIANEVVAYVSSSWSNVFYNEDKCKRDVGYLIDAVRTDLVYGGTERSNIAGLFYYLYPSSATIAGVPSSTAQLDMTVTGMKYASELSQKIALNLTLQKPTDSVLAAANLVRADIPFIQQNVIDYTNDTYPYLNYNQAKCFRDVRFITDAVITDLVYGGNERTREAGYFYYLYPSQATDDQLNETIDAINFGRDLTKLVAIGGLEVERSFDVVSKIIASGSNGYPSSIIKNAEAGIRATNVTQTTSSISVNTIDKNIVSSSFANVINIIANGTGSIPTIVSSSFTGVLIGTGSQITSSITPSNNEINKVGLSFGIVTNIIANGTGSIPTVITNATGSIKRTNSVQFKTNTFVSQTNINLAKSAFDIVLDIVENGTGSLPNLVKNTNGVIKVTGASQTPATGSTSRSVTNSITSSFDTVVNIITNGTGSLPSLVLNTENNIKRTSFVQFVGTGSATSTQSELISSSIGIVSNIVANGIDNLPVIIPYETLSTSSVVINAYNILKNNIPFIQEETIAYLSSSWSGFIYDEDKCKRDVGFILSGSAEDLIWNSNSASVVNGIYYYEIPSQANLSQLNQTLEGIEYASRLAQKVILNTLLVTQSAEITNAYNLIRNNRSFIQSESIAYISSSWSSVEYNENTCKRDISYIIDAVTTDIYYGGNERASKAGLYYFLYPSEATVSQLDETVTGINYAKNLTDRILKGSVFQSVSNNKLEAKELIFNNKSFIASESIAYVSASWNGFVYNEQSCSRDIKYILDAVITDMVYGGNERSIEAGTFYYLYPSEATTTQLGPTLSGIKHAKGLVENVLKNLTYFTASNSNQTAYELLLNNKQLIQNETISFLDSAWSFFTYNKDKCRRDVGYIVDAVATDILYGGNEASARAGEYYYLYPSLATIEGDGNESGQLGQTLDGINYAKGLAKNIVQNKILQTPTTSSLSGWNLLRQNKPLIQAETIAYLSSSWTGVDGFTYNQASCSRDVAYIVDNVATDLLYGGNERSSKAGEYYYLYPSKAIVGGVPSSTAQLEQTIDGVAFAAGVANNIVSNVQLTLPTTFVSSSVELMRNNRTFIQNETIQYIDAFYPDLVYNREKCRRDVGYIVDNVATDLWYGGNERAITAGQYYYLYPSLATKNEQVRETVAGVQYAKNVARKVVQNLLLSTPTLQSNTDSNIKVGNVQQYTSLVSSGQSEVNFISSSFSIVTDIIAGGVEVKPTLVTNASSAIKVTNEIQIKSHISASSIEAGITTASFALIRDIIYNGSASLPDSLASNFNYGFQNNIPSLLHISSFEQTTNGSSSFVQYTSSLSSSFANVINIVNNGTASIPNIVENTSASIKAQSVISQILPSTNGGTFEKNRINTLYNIVLDIIESETYPTIVSNTSASVKVTNTPQFLSGSGADRIQSKIVSSSFGVVTKILLNGTGSVIYQAPNATPNANSKINLAYNLLLNNKQMIVDETIAFMSSSWSTFVYNEASCSRDLGFIIDGAAYDLLYGGNSASIVNGNYYYDFPSAATGSQLDQTVTAIKFASGLAEKVVRNITLEHISASVSISSSYSTLRQNKQFIQNETIVYLSSSWSEFDYNETTCKRDIGYIIDAVSTDLLYGGNERSYVAGKYYYDFPSQATDSQLQPTLDGVQYAKGLSVNIISGSTLQNASNDILSVYNLIKDNKKFIQEETLAFVNAKYPYLYYNEDKCKRDVGFILDAVMTDLKWGGNQRSSKAGEFYYLYPSLATESEQVVETTTAIDYARRMLEQIIIGNVIASPQIISNTTNNIKVTNVPQITGSAATQTEANFISASIGIVANILENGTGSLPTLIAYTTQSTDPNVINAYNNLKQNIPFIAAETVAYISSSWVTGSNSDTAFVYNDLSCSRDVGLIISGAAEDLLWNSNSASIVNGYYYYLYPSQATDSQLDETLDGIKYASQLAQKIVLNTLFVTASTQASASYALMKANKPFIQAETIAYVSSSWVGFDYNEAKCRRDVGLLVDAVSTDILYGGNERSAKAGEYYYKYPSQATGSQVEQTVNAINFAGGIAQNIIKNITFVTASQMVSASVDLLRNNRSFIQEETMNYLTASWSTFDYDKVKCRRDVGYILDGVVTDLLYGGNERTVMSGEFYFKYPSKATLLGDGDGEGQLKQTTDGINYASRVAQKVAQNIVFQTASLEVSASFDLLRKNKAFIAAEVIEYVSSSWSTVFYNEASCSRDVGYIIDAAATDLLYGGTERSITAGSYYFLFPSRATNKGVPSEQNQLDPTVTGIRYAGRLAAKSILNPTYTNASTDSLNARTLLQKNKLFIQKETIAFLSSSWSGLKYNEVSCSRDIGFILDAIATDVVYGGNERSIQAGYYYYKIPSVAIKPSYTDNGTVGQLKQTVDGINYAKGVSEKVVLQTQLTFPPTRRREAYDRLIAAKEELKQRAIGYTNGAFPYLVYNEASCSRDTGIITDSVATDLLYGGNERSIAAASSYYTGQYGSAKAVIGAQKLETLETNRYLRTRAEFIAAGAPLESFGSLIVATGIDYSYNGSGVTFKALPPNQGGSGVANPIYEITELAGGRIYFTSGNQDGDFRIGTGLSINQATGTLVGRTFSKSLFSLVTPFSLALEA